MKPRRWKIVWTDWPTLFCTCAIPAIWLISAAFPLVSPGARFGAVELFAVAIPATLITAGFFVWRVWRIHWFFACGVPTIGRILGVKIVRDRGRLEFGYEMAGRPYATWTPIHKNRQVLALRPNQEVHILVDASRPTKAIVRHLYV